MSRCSEQDHPLWQFSLTLYQAPGVAGCCLRLQDDYAVDVNVLLTACWLASRGLRLRDVLLAELETACKAWRLECVQPLRAARRFIKQQGADEALYLQAKALEVAAERWQQDRLFACCEPYLNEVEQVVDLALYKANVELYIESLKGKACGEGQSEKSSTEGCSEQVVQFLESLHAARGAAAIIP